MSQPTKSFGEKEHQKFSDEENLHNNNNEKVNGEDHVSFQQKDAELSDDKSNSNEKQNASENEEQLKNLPFRKFLNMEAVYRYQVISEHRDIVVPRSTTDNPFTFREILQLLYPEAISRYTGHAIVNKASDGKIITEYHSDSDSILDFSPFFYIFHNNDDGLSTIVEEAVNVAFELRGTDENSYYTHVSVKPIGSTANSVYARITIMPAVDNAKSLQCEQHPSPICFIMVYDVTSPKENLDRYLEIEKSTKEKMKQQQALTVYEDEVLRGMSGMNYPGYNMGLGKWQLEHHCYYDAYLTFYRVYHCLKNEFYHIDKESQAVFFNACHAIGICLQQMGFTDKASYFLQLSMLGGAQYIAAYVESLAIGCHNRVYYFMNQLRQQASQSNQGAAQEAKRLEGVVAAAEANHKVADHLDTGILPLGYVLRHFFDANPNCIMGATVAPLDSTEKTGETLVSKEDIWALNLYDVNDVIIYVHYTRSATEMGIDTDKSESCKNNNLVLNVQRVQSEEGKTIVRVNAMLPHYAQNDEKFYPSAFNIPAHINFIYGTDVPQKQFTREQLKELFDYSLELKSTSRLVEAMRGFEYIHNALKVEYTKVSATDETEMLFFDATCQLGCCLELLGSFERATYYLDWAQEGYKADFAREYVNCLYNNEDIRVLDVINDLLKHMAKPSEPEYAEMYEYFLLFVKQRKVQTLIKRNMLEEAETLLNELVENPLSKEFADEYLKYLKSLAK